MGLQLLPARASGEGCAAFSAAEGATTVQPYAAKGQALMPCGGPLVELKDGKALLLVPGASATPAAAKSVIQLPAASSGKQCEVLLIAVSISALRKEPLPACVDDYLVLDGEDAHSNAELLRWYFAEEREADDAAAEDSGEVKGGKLVGVKPDSGSKERITGGNRKREKSPDKPVDYSGFGLLKSFWGSPTREKEATKDSPGLEEVITVDEEEETASEEEDSGAEDNILDDDSVLEGSKPRRKQGWNVLEARLKDKAPLSEKERDKKLRKLIEAKVVTGEVPFNTFLQYEMMMSLRGSRSHKAPSDSEGSDDGDTGRG